MSSTWLRKPLAMAPRALRLQPLNLKPPEPFISFLLAATAVIAGRARWPFQVPGIASLLAPRVAYEHKLQDFGSITLNRSPGELRPEVPHRHR